jgi:hypothetical protein
MKKEAGIFEFVLILAMKKLKKLWKEMSELMSFLLL